MGLLGNIAMLAASAIIENETTLPTKGKSSAKKMSELDHVKKECFSKHPDYIHYYVSDECEVKDYPFIDYVNFKHYFVYNESDDLLYFFKSKKNEKRKAHLEIYNKNNKKIGDIRESRIALRAPMFHEDNPVDYEIELVKGGSYTISSTLDGFTRLKDSKYGWKLKMKSLLGESVLVDQNTELAYIEVKWYRLMPLKFISIRPDYPELAPIIYSILDDTQAAK